MVVFIKKYFNPYLSMGLWLPCMGEAAINQAGRGFRSFWRYLMVSAIKNVLTIGRDCYISTSRQQKMRSTVNALYKLGSRNPDNQKVFAVLPEKLNIC